MRTRMFAAGAIGFVAALSAAAPASATHEVSIHDPIVRGGTSQFRIHTECALGDTVEVTVTVTQTKPSGREVTATRTFSEACVHNVSGANPNATSINVDMPTARGLHPGEALVTATVTLISTGGSEHSATTTEVVDLQRPPPARAAGGPRLR